MWLGISRDTWAQLWLAAVIALFGLGTAMVIAGIGFGYADHEGTGNFWIRNGWIAIVLGLAGLISGIVIFYLVRPKEPAAPKPEAILRRLIRNVGRIRLWVKPASPTLPLWLAKVVKRSRDDLRACLQQVDEYPQDGHVFFDLDNEHEPSILFSFMYINTAVYTVQLTEVSGVLQVEHKVVPGKFELPDVDLDVVHGRLYRLIVTFVLSTDASQRVLKELIAKSESIHFNLDKREGEAECQRGA